MFRPVDPSSLPSTFERFVTAPLSQVAKIAIAILKSIGAAIHRLFFIQEDNFIREIKKQLIDIQGNFSETSKAQYEICRSLDRVQLDIKCLMTNLKRELQSFSYHNYAFEPVDKQQDEAFFGGLGIEKDEPIESLKEKLTKLEQYVKGLENFKIYKSENSLTLPENHQAVINQKGGRFQKTRRWMELFENQQPSLKQAALHRLVEQNAELNAKSIERVESCLEKVKARLTSETDLSQSSRKLISIGIELVGYAKYFQGIKKTILELRAYTERDFIERFVKFKTSVNSLENYNNNVACFIASTTPSDPSEHLYISRFRELLASFTPPVSAAHAEDGLVVAIEPSSLDGSRAANLQEASGEFPVLSVTQQDSVPKKSAAHAEDGLVVAIEPSSLDGSRAANLQEASGEFPVLSLRQQDSVPKKANSNRQHNRQLRYLDGKT